MHKRTQPNRRAFSLIELTIVVMIIGILAGVAAPKYASSLDHYACEVAARRVALDLRHAANEAKRVGQSREVQFDVAGGAYTLVGVNHLDDRTGSRGDLTRRLSDSEYAVAFISADFGGSPRVAFDSFGRPTASGEVLLRSGDKGRRVALASDGATLIEEVDPTR